MDETDQRVASLFTKKSHHRNISLMYIVQNLFHHRTINLNAHYMVLFQILTDVSQIMALAHQMYPRRTEFFLEAFARAKAMGIEIYGSMVKQILNDVHEADISVVTLFRKQ
jgi:hypothetical protein